MTIAQQLHARAHRRWLLPALAVPTAILIGVALWLLLRPARPPGQQPAATPETPPSALPSVSTAPVTIPPPASSPPPASTTPGRANTSDNETDPAAQFARQRLDNYRHATRYPPTSQPLSEHLEQVQLHRIPPTKRILGDPAAPTGFAVGTQDRVYIAQGDQAKLDVRCFDSSHTPTPCHVTCTAATFVPEPDAGHWTATYEPETVPRPDAPYVEAQVQIGDLRTVVAFSVRYTGPVPAEFTGQIREQLRDGSLEFMLGLNVHNAGQYLIIARLDAADGTPIALLSFNRTLKAGHQQARLSVFGKLLRDQGAASPFRLRDVEGFRLDSAVVGGRQVMHDLAGTIHVTQTYDLDSFSEDEWQSAERQRHLSRFESELPRP